MQNKLDLYLTKYAKLITELGVNVKKGQDIIIYAEIDQSSLVHKIEDAAYKLGANNVIVEWHDLYTSKQFLTHANEQDLVNQPAWLTIRAEELMGRNTSRISILSEDPDGLSDIDPNKVSMFQNSYQNATKAIKKATMNNDISWIVVAASSKNWAHKIFPDLSIEDSYYLLWEKIFKLNYIDENSNPIDNWNSHIKNLQIKTDFLNKNNFKELHYTSSVTDITVGLAKNHIWESAGSVNKQGNIFIANMPTEEIFTSPDFLNVNGHVKSTKPLSYSGVLINDLELDFKDGKIINYTASSGYEILTQLFNTDLGAKYLGEMALVPFNSNISNEDIIFYNTLFDENASNHLAIGSAYPSNVKNGTQLSEDIRHDLGQNTSLVHVDFMMGSFDMNISGLTFDNKIIPIFINGNWA